jgi:DNA polymerase alpha subunit A
MCSSHLKVDRVDIDPEDLPDYFDPTASKPDKLMDFIRHCEADSFFQMAIANKVQALPLTKQLTSLAGNSWNRTLGGGRAERNEYILLHEFHRNKFICPDKISRWEKKNAARANVDPEEEDGEGGAGKGKNKRDKYKGGLVFEPKRGLWDKFILVMDFNSLYPSIIQEYNIDFTTVERTVAAGVSSLLGDSFPSGLNFNRMTRNAFLMCQRSKSEACCHVSFEPWSSDAKQSRVS